MKVLANALWVLLLFNLTSIRFRVCEGICSENEQQALESLKKEVYDPGTDVLSSWIVGKDCCEWKGVVCHNLTRHVIELYIGGSSYKSTRIDNLQGLASLSNLEVLEMNSVDLGKATNWLQVINMLPSLFHLRLHNCGLKNIPPTLLHHNFSSLRTLDLSGNNFSSPIPKWVFSLVTLVSLDLSYSSFTGPFPEGPVNLTSLMTIEASGNSFNSFLPRWFLDLNNLESLGLRNSSLEGVIPNENGSLRKLKYLDLSSNKLSSTIPNWLYQCKNLKALLLRENNLEGVVSNAISNLSSLTFLDFSQNMLSGKLQTEIGKLWKVEYLDLSANLFEGEISELFSSMSNCLPAVLGSCSSLSYLNLGFNKLTGTLPKGLGRHLSMLQEFFILNNRLAGVVTESHFTNMTQLKKFSASRNNITLNVSQNWIPPFQATFIKISGWRIGPQFPMWLQSQKQIESLDISNCGIKGEVPTWFWLSSRLQFLNISHNQFVGEVPNISSRQEGPLSVAGGPWLMYLSSNNFSGPLPQIPTFVTHLDLSNNFFSGGLSHFLCEAKNKSHNYLVTLNLGNNDLSEEIPDCWMNWPQLTAIILRENNFIGGIPISMEVLSDLQSLDLRRNSLSGPFPSSLRSCTKLHKIDLAENNFVGQLPPWIGIRLSSLMILSLRSNKFHGELPPELCHLKDLQILDLADNRFFGIIPRCIGNFTAMVTEKKLMIIENYDELYSRIDTVFVRESAMVATKGNMYQYDTILALVTSMDMSNNNLSEEIPVNLTSLVGLRSFNFSKNHLAGRIPNGIGDMKVLESVDLSENQLSGQIPQSLSSLSTLGFLNLSYNNLSGKIPESTQLQSFSPSSFQGNNLCGLPLLVNCSSTSQIPSVVNEKDESDGDEIDWFYISMGIGFALTFWAVSALFIFKRSWRHAYYRFLDSTWKALSRSKA